MGNPGVRVMVSSGFFPCMAWRAIPVSLSKRKRRLDSLEAAHQNTYYLALYGKRLLISALNQNIRNSLVVQWLGLHVFTAKGMGSIPGQGTKIPQARQHGQN